MEDRVREEYFELLRFKTVGADPSCLHECVACASWLKRWLTDLGFEVSLHYPERTDGALQALPPPVLFAERKGDEGAPSVLFYGHYDVQPPDPVEEWKTPPFEPAVVGDRVYARGAQDDKGQFFAFLCGLRDYLKSDPPPSSVPGMKILLEGQEESGSAALTRMAEDMRRRLAADILLVSDTSAAAGLRPAIVAGLRGVSHFTLRLTGPARDLHSGEYGGVAPNPAQAIAELVASLHNPDGSVAVEGFRDGIAQPQPDELELAEEFAQSDVIWAADIGCDPVGGEQGLTCVRRNSFEPTIEINGIHSGYGGPGSKTVIPCEAFAKISMRLVPGQNPTRVFEAVRRHLEERLPRGMKLYVEESAPGAPGFRLPVASPLFRLAEDVLRGMDDRDPVFFWEGASIPVISVLREASGAAPLLVGWGQAEDRIHSPNESFSFAQFAKGRQWASRILAAIAL